MTEHERTNQVLVGFLCGAAVGAGIALLTAPSSGAVTRKRLEGTARKVANTTRQQFDRMRGRISNLRQDVKDSLTNGIEEMRATPR